MRKCNRKFAAKRSAVPHQAYLAHATVNNKQFQLAANSLLLGMLNKAQA